MVMLLFRYGYVMVMLCYGYVIVMLWFPPNLHIKRVGSGEHSRTKLQGRAENAWNRHSRPQIRTMALPASDGFFLPRDYVYMLRLLLLLPLRIPIHIYIYIYTYAFMSIKLIYIYMYVYINMHVYINVYI